MKKLTLIRHGCAASARGITDFERPLNKQGLREANNMSQQLLQQGFSFDQMFCSTAQRTLTTADIIYAALKPADQPLLADQALYEFDPEPLHRFIELINDDIQHAVIVAHNPGLSYLANALLREPIRGMNTCTAVQMQLNINSWIDIHSRCGQLLSINNPA